MTDRFDMVSRLSRCSRLAFRSLLGLVAALAATACSAASRTVKATDPASPLKLERVIELPDVKGRIDHLASTSSTAICSSRNMAMARWVLEVGPRA
jgi:hypothetical protein